MQLQTYVLGGETMALSEADIYPLKGGCACGQVRYRIRIKPMYVHCCHCRWCQRESGSAFALNAMIESDQVEVFQGQVEKVKIPSESGKGQTFARCPNCQIAMWSHYAGSGQNISFIRVGTLDEPDHVPPDIHIYTASKQPWVALNTDLPNKSGYYDRAKLWPKESLDRRAAAVGKTSA
ncbi:GFA family protein [Marinicella sp. W31]|uniref:GFA family protein n=1 Tax=Marinicella sp. W31 TaxID=3023713 RepID=UPI003756C356